MTDTIGYILLAVLMLVPVAQLLWHRAMRPVRMEFADLGRELLEDETVDEEQAEIINDLLDDAFKWHLPIVLVVMVVPITVYFGLSKIIGANGLSYTPAYRKLRAHPLGQRFLDLNVACVLGSNPIASLFLMIEMIPVTIIFSLAAGSFKVAKMALEERFFAYVGTAKHV
ncbi:MULTISPECIES: hypothetical protein [unclassified Hyphomonas]|uniref:hypothetical protein n=1 Tax=unclassified Hyphomonas TaxID=2630699 RepID=UPI000459075F|nr:MULTISPECIES: hypothetical protein [unclassified Hyphomonas]KCZ49902.1 hypothetical protein HY17_02020 [Hyphomonas sp. CY54-11-8]